MDHKIFYDLCAFAGCIPYLFIVAILAHYVIRRARWKHRRRRGVLTGFCPSSSALAMVFLLTQTFYRPSIRHVIEVKQVMKAEEDDQGEPDTPEQSLKQQLKRIRRGERVERLTLRVSRANSSSGREF
jgi:hypothetical protein